MGAVRSELPVRVTHVAAVPMSLRFLRGQPGFMRARGFELSAVTSPGAELDRFGVDEAVPVTGIPIARAFDPIAQARSVASLLSHLREVRPQIVHAHTPVGGLVGIVAATLARTPVRLYHMRGLPLTAATGWKREVLTAAERLVCALAHEVYCVSHSLRDLAIELRLAPPEKLRVLAGGSGQGVDAAGVFDPARVGASVRDSVRAHLGIASDALVFGFVGRIVRDKGIHELAAAWAQVREALPGAHLVVVGDADERDPVAPGVWAQLQDDPRVSCVGWASEPAALYAAMDVVVLPTYREGFPNVLLEAGSMALPVVATEVPGCVDAVLEGQTGWLVPAQASEALARAMVRYADPSLRAKHGAAARARVLREFRREAIWAAIADRYAFWSGRGPQPASIAVEASMHG